MKKNILLILIFLLIALGTISLLKYVSNNIIGNTQGVAQVIKDYIPETLKNFLKNTLFKNQYLAKEKLMNEKVVNKIYIDKISLHEKKLSLIDNQTLISSKGKKYTLKKFYYPYLDTYTMGMKPPGYLDIYNDFLIIATGQADFIYINLEDLNGQEVNFNFLNSNFDEFIDKKKYIQRNIVGPRDIEIIEDEIFISYVDKDSCNKLSIARAKINFNFLNFEKFFSWDSCVNEELGFKKENGLLDQASGGRIRNFNTENLFFTIGNYDEYSSQSALSQDMNSLHGSIIKINKKNKNYTIISKGHRNQQGLYYDKTNNYLLSTEHGPDGGDELNIINTKIEKIENFGWPISSYGYHYPSKHHDWEKINKKDLMYKLAPLHKSHSKFGFKEPLKNWTPSIAVSEIIKIPNTFDSSFDNDFFIGAMGNVIAQGDQTIHHVRLNKSFDEIIFSDEIILKERIRDIVYSEKDNSVILMLGSTPSLAILKN